MTQNDIEVQEKEGVEELRHRLKGTMSPEMYADTKLFLRFLRARNHNINFAENMLRNHLNWRKFNKIDSVLQWFKPSEVTKTYLPFNKLGFDREGYPVTYCPFGNLDIRGLLKSIKISEAINFVIHLLEKDIVVMAEQSKKLDKDIDQWVHILNFENFPLSIATHKHSVETVGKVISMYEGNYPERLRFAIIINASWYFQIAFAIVKPLITGQTLQKIKIYGKDGWQEELQSLMDVDQLPAFLGGNKTAADGDPMCRSFINHAGPVPESYYAENHRVPLAGTPGVKKLAISRLAKVQVELNVLYAGSDIEWEFETKGRDISFTLLYKESKYSKMEPKPLLPKQRIDTSISSECGLFKTEKAGIYYLEFDNTYSWIHHKEVYYRARITNPHEKSNGA